MAQQEISACIENTTKMKATAIKQPIKENPKSTQTILAKSKLNSYKGAKKLENFTAVGFGVFT